MSAFNTPILLTFFTLFAQAQAPSYPDRLVRFIVPFTAGGAADMVARTVGQKISLEVNQQIIVENRVGGDGNIGAEFVARSAPDGYTILLGFVGNIVVAPLLSRSVPFDPVRDFAPISVLVAAPNILVVHPSFPATTFGEFIAYVKANPGKVNFASSVPGGPAHLAGEFLKRAAGINMVHVPYKGASQAIVDVMGGEVQAMIGLSVVLPQVKAGKLRALATTGLRRLPLLPQVPTVAELGFPGFEATAWYGLLAPAGTPAPIVSRLHDLSVRALKSPDVTARMEAAGNDIIGGTPEAFAAYIKTETRKWGEIVAAAGVKVE